MLFVFDGTLSIRNDPRLMRETPEILAIAEALERPAGQYTSYGVGSIGGMVGTILVAANHSQAPVKVAAVAFMLLRVGCNLLIWKCGTLLMATIDKSLQNSAAVNSSRPVQSQPHQRKTGEGEKVATPRRPGRRGREETRTCWRRGRKSRRLC